MPEFGRLTAVFDADTGKFDAAAKRVEAGNKQIETQAGRTGKALDNAFKTPSRSLDSLSQQLNSVFGSRLSGVTQGVSSLSSSLSGLDQITNTTSGSFTALAGPAGIVVAGLGAITTGAVAAAGAIYGLVTSTAEGTGKFKDLAQQTGFSVETLSAMANAAETSGGSIDTAANALIQFQTHMVEARQKGSEMSALFKVLKIDTTNNEKALRQAFTALTSLTNAEDRATVGKKLFGRSIKEVMGFLKEAGNFDAYLNDQLRKGLLVTTEAAERGDLLSDSVIEMGRAYEAARRIVADQFGPDVLRIIKSVTIFIEENRGTIGTWAHEWVTYFHDAANGVVVLYNGIKDLNGSIAQLSGFGVPDIIKYLSYLSPGGLSLIPALGRAMRGGGAAGPSAPIPASQQYSSVGGWFSKPFQMPKATGGGGGGGAKEDPGVRLLKQLEEQFKNLTPRTEAQKIADELLEKQYLHTSDALKKRIQITAIEIDQMKDAQKLFEKTAELTRALGEKGEKGFIRARRAADTFFAGDLSKTILTFQEEMEQLGDTIRTMGEKGERGFTRIRHAADIFLNTRKRLAGIAPEGDRDLIDLGGGDLGGRSVALREQQRSLSDLLTSSRPRLATSSQQILHGEIERVQAEMQDLGRELTDIFSQSVYTGLHEGGLRGLAEFGLQLGHVVEENFLKKIAAGLGDLLSGVANRGGFWSGLLKALGFGAASGAAGGLVNLGGGSTYTPGGTGATRPRIVGRATGGPIWPDQMYQVHRDELIVPTAPGFVIPKGMGQQKQEIHIHNTFNLPDNPRGSYHSPKSARQQAEMIAALLAQQLS